MKNEENLDQLIENIHRTADLQLSNESKLQEWVVGFAESVHKAVPNRQLVLGKPQGVARWHSLDVLFPTGQKRRLVMLRVHMERSCAHLWLAYESNRYPYTSNESSVDRRLILSQALLYVVLTEMIVDAPVSVIFHEALLEQDDA